MKKITELDSNEALVAGIVVGLVIVATINIVGIIKDTKTYEQRENRLNAEFTRFLNALYTSKAERDTIAI